MILKAGRKMKMLFSEQAGRTSSSNYLRTICEFPDSLKLAQEQPGITF